MGSEAYANLWAVGVWRSGSAPAWGAGGRRFKSSHPDQSEPPSGTAASIHLIRIPADPNIGSLGPLLVSWHGFFTFLGVAAAIFLIARWARREGLGSEAVYNVAIWAVLAGIVGARLVHVVDNWEFYQNDLPQILAINVGGVGLWGGLLGGLAGGIIAAWRMGYPILKMMDLSAPALIFSQGIGRIGDVINGEHCSKATDLPWGFVYTNPESPAFSCTPLGGAGLTETHAMHPAVGYELIYDILAFGFLYKFVRGRIKPDGMLFVLYLAMYATGRLLIQTFFRLDPKFIGSLQEAQVIAISVLVVTGVVLLWKARPKTASDTGSAATFPQGPKLKGTRAERRRKDR